MKQKLMLFILFQFALTRELADAPTAKAFNLNYCVSEYLAWTLTFPQQVTALLVIFLKKNMSRYILKMRSR
jgi:hypothetical protein